MELKVKGSVAGSMYCNIQLAKDAFDVSYVELIEQLKNKDIALELGKGSYYVSSYRRVYHDDKNIYLEGAELVSK